MNKFRYYHIDLGMFTTQVKLCFDQAGLDNILEDHSIDLKISAFDNGVAETHYLTDGREGIVIMLIDLEHCSSNVHYLHGVITHEAYHATCRVFEHIGEKIQNVGEEIVAYTIEYITKQVSAAATKELEKRSVGKKRRSVPKQKSKTVRRSVVQMDKQCNGRARSDSIPEWSSMAGGTENDLREAVSAAESHIRATQPTGASSVCITKQRGH